MEKHPHRFLRPPTTQGLTLPRPTPPEIPYRKLALQGQAKGPTPKKKHAGETRSP